MKTILLLSLICLAVLPTVAYGDSPSTLWLGSRLGIANNGVLYDGFPDANAQPPAGAKWYFSGYGSSTPVDLGGGNWGVQVKDFSDSGYAQWSKSFSFTEYIAASRFRVDANASNGNLLQASAKWDSPAMAIGIRNGRFKALEYAGGTTVIDLGAVTPGQWVEAGLYVNSSTGQAGYWFNNAGSTFRATKTSNLGAHVDFGAETYWAPSGTSTVTFDWVGVYTVPAVPEPGSLAVLGTGLIGLLGVIRRKR